MVEYILTCSCFRMDKKAIEAFATMFPDRVVPDIVRGRDRIFKLSQSLNNEHIKAIAKLTGRYAYYIELDNGIIVREYDLLRGKRIS